MVDIFKDEKMEENKEKRLDSELQIKKEFYIRPKVANKKMKAAHTILQTVYLYGMSGCGKTAFIRDYMGKRKYHYFSAEHLSGEELDFPYREKQIIVIIDDLHQLRTDELREVIVKKIEMLVRRQDVWLILSG